MTGYMRITAIILILALLAAVPIKAADESDTYQTEQRGSALRAFVISLVSGFLCNNKLRTDITTKNLLGIGIATSANIAAGRLMFQRRDLLAQTASIVCGYLIGAAIGHQMR
jgi:CBS-domain-containing membrane protein